LLNAAEPAQNDPDPWGCPKNWAEADRLRAELHAAGWEVEDRSDGFALKKR
jgi:cysteinyl-tRNA synthetase